MKRKIVAVVFFYLVIQKLIRIIPGAQFTWYWHIGLLALLFPYVITATRGRFSRLDFLMFLYLLGIGFTLLSNLLLDNTKGFDYFLLVLFLPVGCWAFFRRFRVSEIDLERYILVLSICLSLIYLYDFISHSFFPDHTLFNYRIISSFEDGRPRGTFAYGVSPFYASYKVYPPPGITQKYQTTGVFYFSLFFYHLMCRRSTRFKAANSVGMMLSILCGLLSCSGTGYLLFFLMFGPLVFWRYRWVVLPISVAVAPVVALLMKTWYEPVVSWEYVGAARSGLAAMLDHVLAFPISLIVGDPGRNFGAGSQLLDMLFQLGVINYIVLLSLLLYTIWKCPRRFHRIGAGLAAMALTLVLGSFHYDSISLHPINMILFSLVGLVSGWPYRRTEPVGPVPFGRKRSFFQQQGIQAVKG